MTLVITTFDFSDFFDFFSFFDFFDFFFFVSSSELEDASELETSSSSELLTSVDSSLEDSSVDSSSLKIPFYYVIFALYDVIFDIIIEQRILSINPLELETKRKLAPFLTRKTWQ